MICNKTRVQPSYHAVDLCPRYLHMMWDLFHAPGWPNTSTLPVDDFLMRFLPWWVATSTHFPHHRSLRPRRLGGHVVGQRLTIFLILNFPGYQRWPPYCDLNDKASPWPLSLLMWRGSLESYFGPDAIDDDAVVKLLLCFLVALLQSCEKDQPAMGILPWMRRLLCRFPLRQTAHEYVYKHAAVKLLLPSTCCPSVCLT